MKALLKRFRRSKKVRFGLLLFFILYVGSYTALSALGNYEDNGGSLAKIGLNFADISDRAEWQPKSVIVTGLSDSSISLFANPAGYFFMPMVFLDRLFVHRTNPIYHS